MTTRKSLALGAAALAAACLLVPLFGCSDDDGGSDDRILPPPDPDFATIVYRLDDSANHTFTTGDGLAWKGSFSYDAERRVLTHDGAWSGPYVTLYDDGPWGAVDVLIMIDLSSDGGNLPEPWSGTDWTGDAAIAGNFTGGERVPLRAFPEIGVDYYGFLLSEYVGPHDGLVHRGDELFWIMVLGGQEYRVNGTACNLMVMPRFLIDGQWWGGYDVGVRPDGEYLTINVP